MPIPAVDILLLHLALASWAMCTLHHQALPPLGSTTRATRAYLLAHARPSEPTRSSLLLPPCTRQAHLTTCAPLAHINAHHARTDMPLPCRCQQPQHSEPSPIIDSAARSQRGCSSAPSKLTKVVHACMDGVMRPSQARAVIKQTPRCGYRG